MNNPNTFRDLSRPMGAQTPDRLKQFEKRYADWDDPTGRSNAFHCFRDVIFCMFIVATLAVPSTLENRSDLIVTCYYMNVKCRLFHFCSRVMHANINIYLNIV